MIDVETGVGSYDLTHFRVARFGKSYKNIPANINNYHVAMYPAHRWFGGQLLKTCICGDLRVFDGIISFTVM